MEAITPNEIDEQPLPETVAWGTIADQPTSLADISIEDSNTLNAATTGLADLSIQGWQFDAIFSATGQQSVAWTAGTLRFKDGTTFSIVLGSVSSISTSVPTYLYFDRAASTTVLQATTTAVNAVGQNKVLIGVAQGNSASGKLAIFQVFGGAGGVSPFVTGSQIAAQTILAGNIAAGTITGNEIAANTITANKLSVATLDAISANVGTLTSGNITGLTITGGLFRTAASGKRIEIQTSDHNHIYFFSATSTNIGSIEVDGDTSTGFLRVISPDGGGLEIEYDVGAAAIATATLSGGGGAFTSTGSGGVAYIGMYMTDSGTEYLAIDHSAGTTKLVTDLPWASTLKPIADVSYDLGTSSLKWSTVYAATISGLTTLSVSGGISTGTLTVGTIPVPRIYSGYCSGTTISKATSNPFTVSSGGTGIYIFTHNWGSTNYVVLATALRAAGAGAYSAKVADLSSNTFEIRIFDDAGASQASDFMYDVHRN